MENRLITAKEIIDIPIIENNDPLIDIKSESKLAFGEPPECELTKNDYTLMRQTIYDKLLRAQDALPHPLRFRLYEAYRSLKVQAMLFKEELSKVKERMPQLSHEAQFFEATRLVSPVYHLDGSKNTPPHATGAAVDVEIINAHGEPIDMGMDIRNWLNVAPELCATHFDKLSNKAKSNRQLLLDVMQAEGFVNYFTEWWHFSYGDKLWAYHTQSPHAIFGFPSAGTDVGG